MTGTRLQQLLPFTVLKLIFSDMSLGDESVATALTVYGIETWISYNPDLIPNDFTLQQLLPFTVLKRFITIFVA